MFSTILFDIDGTIIDTEDVIISSLQEAVSQVTGRELKHDDLQFTLGIPSAVALDELKLEPADRAAVGKLWTELLGKKQKSVRVFATMRRTLAHLQHRGVQLGIITSKNDAELAQEFNRFGLNDYFDVLITSDAAAKPKPSGEPIALALKELSAAKRDTLYIGDSIYDMQSAQDAGVSFAIATWGANDLEHFTKADYMLMQPESILDLAVIK
ncbi:HAD family hydrolase [Lacticaseibacillus pabuli]|uniref:HAD family hydrolase n=1 Tax=Lacticaseibacillus pabuli TaxID=3025672 RepID=A0ABY7WTR8_9LACO|nr:HAD family hydrolase [Lacticaseibacillus sp. KACC 23028]WDF83547.1 HAD family hydrolase [Lacticaseibacillus sp. KACC 23028]